MVVRVGGVLVPWRARRRVLLEEEALGVEHHAVGDVNLGAIVEGDGTRDAPVCVLRRRHAGRGEDVARDEGDAHEAARRGCAAGEPETRRVLSAEEYLKVGEELDLETLAPLLVQHARQARVRHGAEAVDCEQDGGDEGDDAAGGSPFAGYHEHLVVKGRGRVGKALVIWNGEEGGVTDVSQLASDSVPFFWRPITPRSDVGLKGILGASHVRECGNAVSMILEILGAAVYIINMCEEAGGTQSTNCGSRVSIFVQPATRGHAHLDLLWALCQEVDIQGLARRAVRKAYKPCSFFYSLLRQVVMLPIFRGENPQYSRFHSTCKVLRRYIAAETLVDQSECLSGA